MRYYVTLPSGREIPVDVIQVPTGQLEVVVEGRKVEADSFSHGVSTHVSLGGRGVDLWLEGSPPDIGVVANGKRFYARVESERLRIARTATKTRGPEGEGLLTSPMPGRVLKVLVSEGDEVASGAPVVVIEAMKMENELAAPRGGTVKKIHVAPGIAVEGGARLVEIG